MSWITEHWVGITAIGLALLRLAESIVAITPTDKDNKLVATIKEFFRFG
jgi:hypothetical protein